LQIKEVEAGEYVEYINELYMFDSMTVEQAKEIWFEGNRKHGYKKLSEMEDAGFIRKKELPSDRRVKCLLLGAKGARYLGIDPKNTNIKYLDWVISRTQVYVNLLRAGVRKEQVISRKEAVKRYGMDPSKTLLVWVVEGAQLAGLDSRCKIAFYLPIRKRYYSRIYDSVNNMPTVRAGFTHHVLVVEEKERWYRDRKRYAKSPAVEKGFCLWSMDEIQDLVPVLLWGRDACETGSELLRNILGFGEMVEAPFLAPAPYIFRRKASVFFGDLRANDVSLVSRLNHMTVEKQREFGVEGAIVLVRSKRQALEWFRAFNENLGVWYLSEQDGCLYRRVKSSLKLAARPGTPRAGRVVSGQK